MLVLKDMHTGKWADELPGIVWGYRTIEGTTTSEMPFRMAFDTEAILLIKMEIPSF